MDECDILVPPGAYYLGDCCYTVARAEWVPLLERTNYLRTPGEVNGHLVLALGTAYGDGTYRGSDGFSYGVDAGIIGLVHEKAAGTARAIEALANGLVKRVVFEGPTRITNKHGYMTFGDIVIDTIGEEDNGSSDLWDDEEDSEDDDEE